MKYFEGLAFERLNRDWRRRLYECGFTDLEMRGWEDGPLQEPLGARVFAPGSLDILEQCAEESRDLVAAVRGAAELARAALARPEMWRGLPRKARRWWGLQVLAGISPSAGCRMARISRRQGRCWAAEIRRRIDEAAAGAASDGD